MADGLALPQFTPSVPWAGALQGGTGGGRWATPCLPADGGDLGPPPESLGDSETPDPQPPAQLSPEEGQAIGGRGGTWGFPEPRFHPGLRWPLCQNILDAPLLRS